MTRAVVKHFKKVIYVAVFFAVSGNLLQAIPKAFADVGPIASQGERVRLYTELNENLQAESVLQAEIRAGYRLASRPHSAYLLYQKSLGLEGAVADLRQLRIEREAFIQSLNSIPGPVGSGPEAEARFPDLVSTAYSGAPMLSFDDGSRFDSEEAAKTVSARAGFYRLLTGAFLVLAFFLPLLALYQKKTEVPTGKKLVRVFPIFAVLGKNGARALFKLPATGHEPLYPKFGGLEPHLGA